MVEELGTFFSKYRLLKYRKNEVILRAGDTPSGVYYLRSGYVKDFAISKKGQEVTLVVLKPGDFFPVSWTVADFPLVHNYQAITPSEINRCSKNDFISFIKRKPDVLFKLLAGMTVRMRHSLERLEYLAFGNAYEKVSSIIIILAERLLESSLLERNLKGEKIDLEIPLPETHREIGNFLGLSRETASIELEKLKRKKIIDYHGKKLIINDLKRLEEEASFD